MTAKKWNKQIPGYRTLIWACSVPVALLLLLATALPTLQAAQRPIEDFLNAQNDYGVYWIDPQPKYGANFAEIDYSGFKAALMEFYGYPPLGTTFSGTVVERPLRDGRADVEVVLHTRNALAWAGYAPEGWYPTEWLMGGDWWQVIWFGYPLVLGDCTLQLRFINTAPNAPLPHFFAIGTEGTEMISMYFVGSAHGLLADGSPGYMEITQVGLSAPTPDGWPVEHILVKRVGKGGAPTTAAAE